MVPSGEEAPDIPASDSHGRDRIARSIGGERCKALKTLGMLLLWLEILGSLSLFWSVEGKFNSRIE